MPFTVNKIVNKLANNGNIVEEDKEIYAFGLRQGMIITANIITTLIIGTLLKMVWQTILFMILYIPLRSFAGGYHARTQFRCYILSVILIMAVLLVIKYVFIANFVSLLAALVSGVIIYITAPVGDINKPLDDIEIIVYKKWTRIILIIELCMMPIMMWLGFNQALICVSMSLTVLSCLLVMGKILV